MSSGALLKPGKPTAWAFRRCRWTPRCRQVRAYSGAPDANKATRPSWGASTTSGTSWGSVGGLAGSLGVAAAADAKIQHSPSALDGLLPHERAARERLLAAQRKIAESKAESERAQAIQIPAANTSQSQSTSRFPPLREYNPGKPGDHAGDGIEKHAFLGQDQPLNGRALARGLADRRPAFANTNGSPPVRAASSGDLQGDRLLPHDRAARTQPFRNRSGAAGSIDAQNRAAASPFRVAGNAYGGRSETRHEGYFPRLSHANTLERPPIRSGRHPNWNPNGRAPGHRHSAEPGRSDHRTADRPEPARPPRPQERPFLSSDSSEPTWPPRPRERHFLNKIKVFEPDGSSGTGDWSHFQRRPTPASNGQVFLRSSQQTRTTEKAQHPAPKSDKAGDFWAQVKERYPQSPARTSATGWQQMQETSARENLSHKSDTRSNAWDWVDDHLQGTEKAKNESEVAPKRDSKPDSKPEVNSYAEQEPSRPWRDNRDEGERRNGRDWRDRPEKSNKQRSRRRDTYRDEDMGQDDDEFWDEELAEKRRQRKAEKKAQREREKQLALEADEAEDAGPVPIILPEYISVANLATALGVKQGLFLGQLSELGFEDINAESIMAGDTAALVAQEYGFEPTVESGEGEDLKPRPPPEDPSLLPPRPPVVTIMGHVDHGKTTLLDWLRKSSIAAQEHGGITQHIGAFSVKLSTGKQITFLDTPGHAAFLSMRQRGANVTDIVILVVAADDSVKPQTLEALRHARAAKVPIIVAINKVDKDEARVDQVKADLARNGVEIEEYGGDVQVVCVSGKTGQGMQDLEENIVLLSEILDMRAETDGMAEGWVLESSIKPVGRVATVLVKRGTLRQGDYIVAGNVWSKIRILRNEAGVEIDEAPPGTPVEILGWKDPPDAGDQVLQAPDEAKAKAAVHYRLELKERGEIIEQMAKQEEERRQRELEEAAAKAEEEGQSGHDAEGAEQPSGTKIVNFIVKGDVHGSVEAVSASIMEIGNNEVRPRILVSSTGQVTESDVEHAGTTGSHIVNFNNVIPGNIKRLADEANVKILDHTIIYHLVDDVRDSLSEHLAPIISSRVLGEAEVLQTFRFNIKGRQYKNIAGCRVRNGVVAKNAKYRVLRNGEKIFEGNLEGLKHGKTDVSEMRKGAECGMSFMEWEGFQQGDQIQAFEEIREKRKL